MISAPDIIGWALTVLASIPEQQAINRKKNDKKRG
jgi:hypothetical protein